MGSFQPWANPDPQSIAGLNSSMVYGENVQFAVGINHQVAVGSNLQLCINPGTFMSEMAGPACAALGGFFGGGGLGGNLQFTIGTNTNITWGRQYTVNMGGESISYEASQQTVGSKALCAVIGGVCIAYSIAYGACSDEDGRASILIAFQIVMDALLGAFMVYQASLKAARQSITDIATGLWGATKQEHSSKWELAGLLTAAALTGVVGALVTPAVAVAAEENHFQGQTQSSS
jgi:hypothetical protein